MEKLPVARDIMTTRVMTLASETNVVAAMARLLENRLTGAPVVDDGYRYLGIFSEKRAMDVLLSAARLFEQRNGGLPPLAAREIMETDLVTLRPDEDVFDAVGKLLDRRISGAPVLDADGRYLGVFSEKTSMSALVGAAYDQLPTSEVRAFLSVDPSRVIDENLDWMAIAAIFVETPLRRLPVLRGDRLVGQISRRDVLGAALSLAKQTPEYLETVRQPGDGSIPNTVGEAMDRNAATVAPNASLLDLATIFRDSPYRQLTVLHGPKLEGIVSRRDVLQATRRIVTASPKRGKVLLYLSAVTDREPAAVQ